MWYWSKAVAAGAATSLRVPVSTWTVTSDVVTVAPSAGEVMRTVGVAPAAVAPALAAVFVGVAAAVISGLATRASHAASSAIAAARLIQVIASTP